MRALPIVGTLAALFFQSLELSAAPSAWPSTAALIERLLPGRSGDFVLEAVPAEDGKDVFELESRAGKVVLRGNTPLSAAVGLNWYLKYSAHCSVSLNGRNLDLPSPAPAVEKKVRQVGWAKSRYLFNYCTFGYSMPWWDWKQWEACIDWMALNGVNQPLAVTGQEAIWQAVCRRFGMTDAEIDAFLAGPPYLPFQWMGCLDGHGGPLPKDWIPQHVELEKKILARERELGMTPVLQGFTGHVPEALLKKFPDAKAQKIRWIEWNTWMLDPTHPLFQQIGAAFVEEQTKLFGSDHLYAADSFIEMRPPSGDLDYLAKLGRAIYDGMAKTDPQAVWLLQGWTFMNQSSFWKQDRIKAFLDAVPNDGLQVLDLFCENRPVWNQTQGFYGKPWVWNFVYNFGNNTIIGGSGPLARFNDLAPARRDPMGRSLRGVGLMMEGFSHNPLLYDLMFELAWRDDVELGAWFQGFARFRYGRENADAQAAWELLRTAAYGHNRNTQSQTAITVFPAVGRTGARYPEAALAKAWRRLLQAAPELGRTETYRHDLVNVARQTLSSRAGELCAKAMAAAQAKDAAGHRQAAAEFLQLIGDLDELLATSDQFLLGKWLEDAKRWGATEGERAKLEWNARRVLTLWGQGTHLRDYAWKEWSGLLTGFYAKRWEIFFKRQQEALDAATAFDQAACHKEILQFENDWSTGHEAYPASPRGDSIEVARRLYAKYAPQPISHLALDKPVTCSFALPGMDAERANDGVIDTESYWGTDVAQDQAAWWQVDFEKPTAVGRVVVIGYYGEPRHYGFTVQGSLDGKEWTMLADRRDNTAPSTKDGYECRFEPRPIRYLRVTETANSANSGRHLVEVMAFKE
jgi:alpha-N-acetylglucosaminidase